MKLIKFLSGIILAGVLTGCTGFLNVKPDKSGSSVIYHMDQLADLMGNAYMYGVNGGCFIWTESIYMSDDCTISPYYYSKREIGGMAYEVSVWNRDIFDDPSMEVLSWSAYSNMFTFNTVLEYADKVEQTTPAMKETVKGEALFGRAYFHFCALVMFARWEDTAPGLGYKDDTNPLSIPERETVKYTVDRIARDLLDAENALKAAGRTAFEQKRNFRITLPTLYAFKARFELYRGNYTAALECAEKALAGHSKLVDFKNDPRYEMKNRRSVDILDRQGKPTGEQLHYYEMSNLLTEGGRAVAEYEEFYLPHMTDLYIGSWCIPISKSLYDLFDKENDERWKHFYNNNHNVVQTGFTAQKGFKYEDQQNLQPWEYHTYLRFVANVWSSGKLYPLGPTTAEMMLIKAECLSRSGKTGDARTLLQNLRKTRFTTVEAANNIEGSVQEVLDERRRELTAVFRWYDIKRLNGKEHANIMLAKQRYTDVSDLLSPVITVELNPNDPFYAIPMTKQQVLLMGWENN